jgi:hypothetical protein
MFYDVPISELTLQFLGAPPFGIQPDIYYSTDMTRPYTTSLENPIPNPFPYTPIQPGARFNFASIAPIGITVMDPDFRTPYTMQWNFQVQRQLMADWRVEATYVGASGTKLLNRRELNWGMLTPTATSGNIHSRRIYNLAHPQGAAYGGAPFAGITNQSTDAKSNYNSLQLALNKRFSRGFQMLHSYTWGHSIDNGSGLRVSGNPFNARLDRGNSEYDVRHRYSGSVVYQLPFLRDQQGVIGRALGGWEVSTVISLQTGFPFDITEPTDRCLCGAGGQRPDYIGGEVAFVDPRLNSFSRLNSYFDGSGGGSATGAPNPYFRRVGSAATVAGGAGRYGTLGRNVFHGPGIQTVDLSLLKSFRLAERHRVDFRGEAFNLLNHTNFLNPSGNIGTATFGRITGARDPRLIQLSLRYWF